MRDAVEMLGVLLFFLVSWLGLSIFMAMVTAVVSAPWLLLVWVLWA